MFCCLVLKFFNTRQVVIVVEFCCGPSFFLGQVLLSCSFEPQRPHDRFLHFLGALSVFGVSLLVMLEKIYGGKGAGAIAVDNENFEQRMPVTTRYSTDCLIDNQ